MKKLYSIAFLISFALVNFQAVASSLASASRSFGVADTSKKISKIGLKYAEAKKDKKVLNVEIVPFQPVNVKASQNNSASNAASSSKTNQPELKVVSNVKVYPNPVAEQLNLTYNVNKDSNVTIKIMDVLGNEIATLLSQKMSAGEQTNSFNIDSKLHSGYYFIRLIVGTETIVKRISVL